jgi:hypothetical protein
MSGIKREVFDIDGDKYELCRLPVKHQIDVHIDLLKQFGESVAQGLAEGLADNMDTQKLLSADSLILLSGGMESLVKNVDSEVLLRLCRKLFDGALVNGKPMFGPSDEGYELFDTHFSGRMVHLMKVFGKAVQFNWGPFSGAKQ